MHKAGWDAPHGAAPPGAPPPPPPGSPRRSMPSPRSSSDGAAASRSAPPPGGNFVPPLAHYLDNDPLPALPKRRDFTPIPHPSPMWGTHTAYLPAMVRVDCLSGVRHDHLADSTRGSSLALADKPLR